MPTSTMAEQTWLIHILRLIHSAHVYLVYWSMSCGPNDLTSCIHYNTHSQMLRSFPLTPALSLPLSLFLQIFYLLSVLSELEMVKLWTIHVYVALDKPLVLLYIHDMYIPHHQTTLSVYIHCMCAWVGGCGENFMSDLEILASFIHVYDICVALSEFVY